MSLTFDAVFDWYKTLEDSSNYLPIDQMQPGMAYAIWARNAYVGIWLPTAQGFIISRYKYSSSPFLFIEYHWDTSDSLGTAKPLRSLESCPLFNLEKIEARDKKTCAVLCEWLDDLEIRYPPIPGYNTVDERRNAVKDWAVRQTIRRLAR